MYTTLPKRVWNRLYGVDLLRDNGIAVIVNCREKEENGVGYQADYRQAHH